MMSKESAKRIARQEKCDMQQQSNHAPEENVPAVARS